LAKEVMRAMHKTVNIASASRKINKIEKVWVLPEKAGQRRPGLGPTPEGQGKEGEKGGVACTGFGK